PPLGQDVFELAPSRLALLRGSRARAGTPPRVDESIVVLVFVALRDEVIIEIEVIVVSLHNALLTTSYGHPRTRKLDSRASHEPGPSPHPCRCARRYAATSPRKFLLNQQHPKTTGPEACGLYTMHGRFQWVHCKTPATLLGQPKPAGFVTAQHLPGRGQNTPGGGCPGRVGTRRKIGPEGPYFK